VYATGKGLLCQRCGWPLGDCHCSTELDEPVPAQLTAVLGLEKKGRGGKAVTVIAGLPRNEGFLKALAAELKRGCGTGGTVAAGTVEIQGDQRQRVRALLAAKGFTVKG
jgi:translation initiation factor 1